MQTGIKQGEGDVLLPERPASQARPRYVTRAPRAPPVARVGISDRLTKMRESDLVWGISPDFRTASVGTWRLHTCPNLAQFNLAGGKMDRPTDCSVLAQAGTPRWLWGRESSLADQTSTA